MDPKRLIVAIVAGIVSAVFIYKFTTNSSYRRRVGHFFKSLIPPPQYRMLVAVRHRRNVRNQLASMDPKAYMGVMEKVTLQLKEIDKKWRKLGHFESGFYRSEYGIPGPGDENWLVFAVYHVSSYRHYRQCLMILESPEFLPLRHYCEFHIIFGRKLKYLHLASHELL